MHCHRGQHHSPNTRQNCCHRCIIPQTLISQIQRTRQWPCLISKGRADCDHKWDVARSVSLCFLAQRRVFLLLNTITQPWAMTQHSFTVLTRYSEPDYTWGWLILYSNWCPRLISVCMGVCSIKYKSSSHPTSFFVTIPFQGLLRNNWWSVSHNHSTHIFSGPELSYQY